jgi:hypothetical protein
MEDSMDPKVLSKFYRLKLTDQIRDLITALPTENLQETQVGNHVYYAKGQFKVGSQSYPGRIRIWLWNRNISISVKSEEIGFNIVCPFNDEMEQKRAAQVINENLQKHLN